ncbi:P-loop containing nucleoside triphosphate hydrolase protein [Mycena rebaudengoi]|nr:P-loop containing nucleoside triphosphate hydrolase protein [Mycena rebaudengoi]
MSDHPKQPKRNWSELGDELHKSTRKRSPAPPPQPSRSTTPAPSNKQGSSPGASAINPASAPSRVDPGEDLLKGSKPDTSDTAQSESGSDSDINPYDARRKIHIQNVHGGTGGAGGEGKYGGGGGGGEGPVFHASQMFVGNMNVATEHDKHKDFIKEKLANHVATRHEYTDQSKSLCAPNTRVDIKEEIIQWLLRPPSNREHIFWITGIAGSGKSTLSATVVNDLRIDNKPVAAQFFISRNIPDTIDPKKVIPTIAKQLADSFPTAARIIHDTLKVGFPPTQKEQAEKLLLAPIRELSNSCDLVIILIDALDELQNADESVLDMLSQIAPRDCDLPDNIRFIITSRPEHWADISGSETLELAVFKQHSLETGSSVDEVHNFIVARMGEITPRDWIGWPTLDKLLELSRKADGLFHYAATALQWIKEQIRKHNKSCQPWVFDRLTQMRGLDPLKDLYKLILTSFEDISQPAEDVLLRADRLRGFQHVIGTILVLYKPLTIHQIIALLADIPVAKLDVAYFLQQFRSVLLPGMTVSFKEATPQMHKSFRDYIMNAAPTEFRILTGDAHFVTARSCLEVIVKARSGSDIGVKYAVEYWHQHLRAAVKAVEEGSIWEDERMWNLIGQMVEKAVIEIWAKTLTGLFTNVAAAGWGLLKVR